MDTRRLLLKLRLARPARGAASVLPAGSMLPVRRGPRAAWRWRPAA